MDCLRLYQDKFLKFFNSKTFNENDEMFDLYLNEIIDFFENLPENIKTEYSPVEIIKSLRDKFSVETTMEVVGLLNRDVVKDLSTLEIITMLWYCSCKNAFLFVEAFYIERTKDGSIGLLLNELHDRKA